MRAVRTTREDNLIKLHFGIQEVDQTCAVQEDKEQTHESNLVCEDGVCTLNWSPVHPSKKSEAA